MLRPLFSVAALAVAGFVASPSTTSLQAGAHTLYVIAIDDRGGLVTDLQPEDLQVRLGGTRLEILRAGPAQATLRIAVIVSDAGTGGFQQGVATFVQKLLGRAEFGLISVITQPELVAGYSGDAAVLREGIRRLGLRARQHGAQVMEAIQEAARDVAGEGTRPVILVLRVGVEGITSIAGRDVRDTLRRSGAILYVVSTAGAARQQPSSARPGISTEQAQLQDDEIATSQRNLAQVLGDGARESGGRHIEIVSTTTLTPGLERIADELLGQYAVTCAIPQGVRLTDRLSVATTRRGVKIQAPARLR